MSNTINLSAKNKSYIELSYEIQKFPDGQQNIVILDKLDNTGEVLVTSRFSNFMDLEIIICAVKALRKKDAKKINLRIPYLLGARSDREFTSDGNSYLVEVIAPILNSLKVESINCFDVHNPAVTAACIKNFTPYNTYYSFIHKSILNIFGKQIPLFNLVAVDEGASKKILETSKFLYSVGIITKIIQCTKIRELSTGKITGTKVYSEDLQGLPCVIIDDLCDGGASFIGVAKELKENNCGDIYLIVSHAIFSKGLDELKKHFKRIYTTDSYQSEQQIKQLEKKSDCELVTVINKFF